MTHSVEQAKAAALSALADLEFSIGHAADAAGCVGCQRLSELKSYVMTLADTVTARLASQAPERPIYEELERALLKFPTWPTDPLHAVAVLGEEFGELTRAVLQWTYEPHKSDWQDVRTEAIQTAAMAIRLVRSLPVYRTAPCTQHLQQAAQPEAL